MRPSEPAPKPSLPPRVRAVTDGVYQVTTFTLRPPEYVNAFLVDGDEGVTLIDTSMPAGERVILAALAAIGRSVDDITAILLTHCHLDHVGSAAALKRSSGARVFASPTDAPAIEGAAPVPPPPAAERLAMFTSLFRFLPLAAPVHVDRFTAESAANDLPADLSVLDTPGHTPGHVSYLLDRAGGVLFVGDTAMWPSWPAGCDRYSSTSSARNGREPHSTARISPFPSQPFTLGAYLRGWVDGLAVRETDPTLNLLLVVGACRHAVVTPRRRQPLEAPTRPSTQVSGGWGAGDRTTPDVSRTMAQGA